MRGHIHRQIVAEKKLDNDHDGNDNYNANEALLKKNQIEQQEIVSLIAKLTMYTTI